MKEDAGGNAPWTDARSMPPTQTEMLGFLETLRQELALTHPLLADLMWSHVGNVVVTCRGCAAVAPRHEHGCTLAIHAQRLQARESDVRVMIARLGGVG